MLFNLSVSLVWYSEKNIIEIDRPAEKCFFSQATKRSTCHQKRIMAATDQM
jgi:hypothetical protein